MKNIKNILFACIISILALQSCGVKENKTALEEQGLTEINQRGLLTKQPPPQLTWSLERDNLIKRFKLYNDRTILFYMYVFIEGISQPVGYYQVNKVSSVNSQLTNTEQIVSLSSSSHIYEVLPSPAEDGSYGSNGDGIFGFTPEEIYIEHNMKYIVSTVPLTFKEPVNKLTIINLETENQLKTMMDKIKSN